MKLTKEDKKILTDSGHPESDFYQIQKAMDITTFDLDGSSISINEVENMIGRKRLLYGLGRSAFHFTACVEVSEDKIIHFDSSKLFK